MSYVEVIVICVYIDVCLCGMECARDLGERVGLMLEPNIGIQTLEASTAKFGKPSPRP